MSTPKTKIALIGAGGWGYQHARILSAREDVDFCAIVGRTPEKTEARAKKFRTRAYTDITAMCEKERPELVCMCLPNQGHFAATLEVIRAGVPLFVEKPLVFDLKEADTLLEEADKRRLFFGINFNHRYAKAVQRAKQAIVEGRLGDVIFAFWRFGGEGGPKLMHPYANIIESQCHGFDMLEYLCGPIDSIMAEFTDKTGLGFRSLALSLRFASGAVGSFVGTYDSSYAYRGAHLLEINGTKARVTVEDTVRKFTFQAVGSETAEVWEAGYFNDYDREFHRTFDTHFDAMLKAFRAGQPPPIHAAAGRRALALALASAQSFESGKRVRITS